MFRKLFLSIIILSALASENGAYCAADLFDLYLINLPHLDMIQYSRNAITILEAQKTNSLERRGRPASLFKAISEEAINRKTPNKDIHSEFLLLLSALAIVLGIIISAYIFINKSHTSRQALFSLSDSSPPVCC
jgi:hypothetical protein